MLILGIAGGTGCGKTTVVNQIVEQLPQDEVGIISQDSYYNDLSHLSKEERAKVNFDHPNSIDFDLLIEHIELLRQGKSIETPIYSFVEETRMKETITTHPRKVMIVEGILVLSNPKLREMFDIKIYVHADSDERLIRRLQRDTRERGHDLDKVLTRYQTAVKPMHLQFIEPSKEFADIIIPNNHYNTVAVDIVRTIINNKLV
ncbi:MULTISPECIES: uridine kinase [Flavobacteriaceae]|jgi:uridine kinase|uniref:Uridine kinase n=1 Tax=Flagellimonas marinaquae TaxID=254955 RepID=A0AA48KLM1_9FLAO|nr:MULTISPECIES: uridine kinase [Allomuricauda]MCA0957754.1 uridine kinase [Allomuricauda ruestringensis]USD24407.1 uridine kinase [Allomuricauda aquimarina]BDW93272.1 uridine kinase [Allomuricauda aquimarina]